MIEGSSAQDEIGLEEDHPDIQSFVEGYQLKSKYRCSIFQWDSDNSDWAFMDQFKARTPGPEEVAKLFGPGRVKWKFERDEKDQVTGRKLPALEYEMILKGPKWEELHEDFKAEQNEKRLKKFRDRLEKQRLENMVMGNLGGTGTPGETPAQAQKAVAENLVMLKALVPTPGESNMLPLIMKMMTDSAAAQAQNTNALMQMMMQAQQANTQMMVALLNGKNQAPSFNPMETMMPMMGNMLNFFQKTMELKKDMDEPGPDTLTTILEFAKEVLPAALNMLSRVPKGSRAAVVRPIVAGNEHFQSLKNDPELLAEAVKAWDKEYGAEKVDELLDAAGLVRPASTVADAAVVEEDAAAAAEGADSTEPAET